MYIFRNPTASKRGNVQGFHTPGLGYYDDIPSPHSHVCSTPTQPPTPAGSSDPPDGFRTQYEYKLIPATLSRAAAFVFSLLSFALKMVEICRGKNSILSL